VLGLALLINLVLVAPDLMPQLTSLGAFDEAKYVDSGRSLLLGEVRDLAWGPLVGVLYAPLHLGLHGLAHGFLLQAWAGRFLLYTALWVSTLFLGTAFRRYVHLLTITGVLFVSLPFFFVVQNQSDALFVALSSVGLACLLKYRLSGQIVLLTWASTAVGLAVLCRIEGILLVPLLPALAWAFNRKEGEQRRRLIRALAPSLLILVAYLVSVRLSTGTFELGIAGKSWDSFEVNQSVLTDGDLQLARKETRRLFGTAEENNGSVLRAILRNPLAFVERIRANTLAAGEYYLTFFGKRLGAAILLLAAWGVVAILQRREAWLLAVLGVWSVPALVSLGFLVRHLVPQVSLVILILAAIGVEQVFRPARQPHPAIAMLGSAILLTTAGAVAGLPAFTAAGFVLAAAMGLLRAIGPTLDRSEMRLPTSLLILLAGALILRGPYSFPDFPPLGQSPRDRALLALAQAIPAGSPVLVGAPLPALAAGMIDIRLADDLRQPSRAGLDAALRAQGVRAIYLDRGYPIRPGEIETWVREGIGTRYQLIYLDRDQGIQILLVDPDPAQG